MLHLILTARGRLQFGLVALLLGALLVLFQVFAVVDRFALYQHYGAVIHAQQKRGYQLVGRFGSPGWPALVVEMAEGAGQVDFVTPDGQPHRYEGFSGPMKVLFFRHGFGEQGAFVMVFHQDRSQEKGREPGPFQSIQ